MNARARRARARAGKRAAYARISTTEAMRPATGRRGRISYQGSGHDGYRSDWAASASRRDAVTIDARWHATVTNRDA